MPPGAAGRQPLTKAQDGMCGFLCCSKTTRRSGWQRRGNGSAEPDPSQRAEEEPSETGKSDEQYVCEQKLQIRPRDGIWEPESDECAFRDRVDQARTCTRP